MTAPITGTDSKHNAENERVAFLSGSVETGITATASGVQATAYQLTSMFNIITVCATNGDAVKLPPAVHVGMEVTIVNDGAANAQVFGAGTDTIDGVATATGVPLTAAKRCKYVVGTAVGGAVTAGKWLSNMGVKSA